jgi:hypothetical protein
MMSCRKDGNLHFDHVSYRDVHLHPSPCNLQCPRMPQPQIAAGTDTRLDARPSCPTARRERLRERTHLESFSPAPYPPRTLLECLTRHPPHTTNSTSPPNYPSTKPSTSILLQHASARHPAYASCPSPASPRLHTYPLPVQPSVSPHLTPPSRTHSRPQQHTRLYYSRYEVLRTRAKLRMRT